jgi:hypothetical protein
MKRVLTIMLIASTCFVGSTPSFALGGVVHLLARGDVGHGLDSGLVRNPTTLLGASPPPIRTFKNRIPAPLAAPSAAPVINGPAAQSPYGGVM